MNQQNLLQQLDEWYNQPLGQAIAHEEQVQLQEVLPSLFGYSLLQIGAPHMHQWLNPSPIAHKIYLADSGFSATDLSLMADTNALPFPEHSIDVAFLPHTLEFISNPKALLSEVSRVLIPEGHIIILMFNAWSLWNCVRWKNNLRKKNDISSNSFLWNGQFIRLAQLRRELALFNFDICLDRSFFYRPPVEKSSLLNKLLFLETLGRMCGPYPGAVYLVIARHKVAGLTPFRPQRRFQRVFAEKTRLRTPQPVPFSSSYQK